jgi:Pentapeptide repeats (8 copies)
MVNSAHLERLRQGVDAWNAWRTEVPAIRPDLIGADLSRANLIEANLTDADLRRANLFKANLSGADLSWAKLKKTDLIDADLSEADLSGAKLEKTNLIGADLSEADLSGANLSKTKLIRANLSKTKLIRANLNGANLLEADLRLASLVGATCTNAILRGCRIYGISAWELRLKGAWQQDLIITDDGKPEITVDDLEVAQFVYLLLHNEKIRSVIDTITSKMVLILGRFTAERKPTLDALRDELRRRNYLPMLFDFKGPMSRTTDETVTLLARMARFVIADITDAKSVLQGFCQPSRQAIAGPQM